MGRWLSLPPLVLFLLTYRPIERSNPPIELPIPSLVNDSRFWWSGKRKLPIVPLLFFLSVRSRHTQAISEVIQTIDDANRISN